MEVVVGSEGEKKKLPEGENKTKWLAVDSRRAVGRTGVAVAWMGGDLADGPILGMEFDPLPPDAFGAPIGAVTVGQQKQSGWPFEPKLYEWPLLSKCSTKFLRQTDKVALVERRNLGFNSYTIGFR
uniref:Uncharacterized protein n=1 Tax=Fagus sylvatica TaxID=28930 RepID=A0A2N9EUI0_FAGSY